MWEGFIFKSLANCIRFLDCSQTTHGQSRAKTSILSASASSFVTNFLSLSLDPGPKSSCYDIFWTAVCKKTNSSKEFLTKLQNRHLNLFKCINCLSARYYWLQHQIKYLIFKHCILYSRLHTWFKLLSPWTRLTTCKCPAATASCGSHSMQTAVHHRYETSPWFPSNHKLVSHSFGCSTHIHFAHLCPCSCFKHFCQENFTELSWWQELKAFHLLWGVSAPSAFCFCAQLPSVKNFSIDAALIKTLGLQSWYKYSGLQYLLFPFLLILALTLGLHVAWSCNWSDNVCWCGRPCFAWWKFSECIKCP